MILPGTNISFLTKVIDIHEYSAGKDALDNYLLTEGIENVLPGTTQLAREENENPFQYAKKIYLSYFDKDPKKAQEEVEKYGMWALYLEVM